MKTLHRRATAALVISAASALLAPGAHGQGQLQGAAQPAPGASPATSAPAAEGTRGTNPASVWPVAVGPHPQLPPPSDSGLVPTVNIAPAKHWPDGGMPSAPAGFRVTALARNLQHPRNVVALPNGDVLVAEANRPPPLDGKVDKMAQGVKGEAMKLVQKRAGAGVPSADRITLLRDTDGDGVAETRTVFLANLFSPFGMVLVGDTLYIANADAIVKVPYRSGQTQATARPQVVTGLPAGANHHWTKNIIASPDGKKLYATVGSNSNIGENGMASEQGRAAVWEIDVDSGVKRLYASGLRNPTALGWEPQTHRLWVVANERDELGDNLVPDIFTSVQEGAFYGWPWSYWGQHVDERVKPANPQMVAKAIPPDYALGAHVAPLGLAFSTDKMPLPYSNGAFVGEHGSWNRKTLAGYHVAFIPFADGRPSGPPREFLGGFLNSDGDALGRPVGVAMDGKGALIVADDVGNTVWRVAPVR